jgi:hypothetical protein
MPRSGSPRALSREGPFGKAGAKWILRARNVDIGGNDPEVDWTNQPAQRLLPRTTDAERTMIEN